MPFGGEFGVSKSINMRVWSLIWYLEHFIMKCCRICAKLLLRSWVLPSLCQFRACEIVPDCGRAYFSSWGIEWAFIVMNFAVVFSVFWVKVYFVCCWLWSGWSNVSNIPPCLLIISFWVLALKFPTTKAMWSTNLQPQVCWFGFIVANRTFQLGHLFHCCLGMCVAVIWAWSCRFEVLKYSLKSFSSFAFDLVWFRVDLN